MQFGRRDMIQSGKIENTEKGQKMDWIPFVRSVENGKFMGLLKDLPRENWTEHCSDGYTLLHFACQGPNVSAVILLLQSKLLDVNECTIKMHSTPAHIAAWNAQHEVLKVLCAFGADIRAIDINGYSPIDIIFCNRRYLPHDFLRTLVANGVRLSTIHANFKDLIPPELWFFERGVLSCRKAVVAILCISHRMDIAVAVWATRYHKVWQI